MDKVADNLKLRDHDQDVPLYARMGHRAQCWAFVLIHCLNPDCSFDCAVGFHGC